MPNFWIKTPSDYALSEKIGWAQIESNKYAAIRHHLLVVNKSGGKAKNGPILEQMDWPIGAQYEWQNKFTRVTKYTYGIQESITSSVTTKLSHEVLSKIALNAGLTLTALEAKLSAELQTKIGLELTESLQNGLSVTKTYEVSTSEEITDIITFAVAQGADTKPIFVYFKMKPFFWDVYLYRTDYLQLEYRPRPILPDVRKTISSTIIYTKRPLFRVVYYEPVEKVSFKFDSYEPEVTEEELVKSVPLNSGFPGGDPGPTITLEKLAEIAFPKSKKERKASVEKRKSLVRGGAKKGSVRKSPSSSQKSKLRTMRRAKAPSSKRSG